MGALPVGLWIFIHFLVATGATEYNRVVVNYGSTEITCVHRTCKTDPMHDTPYQMPDTCK